MFRYKLLKVGIAAVSLITFLISPFADSLKAITLRRYDLRWQQSADKANQVQTIVVRNAGTELKDNLILELSFDDKASRVLADFEVKSEANGQAEKFMDTVARTSIAGPAELLTAPETALISQLLDRHFAGRTLNYLDGVFDDILSTRFAAAKSGDAFTYLKNKNAMTANWHNDWAQRCAGNQSNDCKSVDTVLGDWEKARSNFRNAVLQNWKERTGISLSSTSDNMSLDKKMLLTFSLQPNEQRFFTFHYNNPGSVAATFRSTKGEQTYHLDDRSSVFYSFIGLLFYFWPILYMFIPLIVVLVILFFGWLLVPLHLLPTYQIFNFAVEYKDEDHWKQALERHRYFIIRQFRAVKSVGGSRAVMDEQQVLDLVRDWLVKRHKNGSPRFRNGELLDRSIHHELLRLALQT